MAGRPCSPPMRAILCQWASLTWTRVLLCRLGLWPLSRSAAIQRRSRSGSRRVSATTTGRTLRWQLARISARRDDRPRGQETADRERRKSSTVLHYNRVSPFVRKAVAVAIETGQDDRLEPVGRMMTPVKPDADLANDNPLGKVPCLVTEDGAALYDLPVICEYLDSLHDGPKMFPPAGSARWRALRRQAEGDGIMDAGVLARYETFLRPEERRWPEWD